MTKKEILKILSLLKVTYPNSYKALTKVDLEALVELWYRQFKDFDYQTVQNAIDAIVSTDESNFAPSIGRIKNMMLKLSSMKNELISEQEAWSLVYKALENSGYHAQEEFDKLPPLVKKIVGSANVLKEWCMMDYQQLNTVVASNFQRSYRARMKYEEEYNALSNNAKQLISATYPQNKIETEDL